MPLYATFNTVNGIISVWFDKDVLAGIKDHTKWFARWGNVQRVNQVAPTALGVRIMWDTTAGGADPGATVVTYDGTDPLMVGQAPQLPIAGFTLPMVGV